MVHGRDKKTAKKVIALAFAALSSRQKENLRFHAERKTQIACGDYAAYYVVKRGYG